MKKLLALSVIEVTNKEGFEHEPSVADYLKSLDSIKETDPELHKIKFLKLAEDTRNDLGLDCLLGFGTSSDASKAHIFVYQGAKPTGEVIDQFVHEEFKIPYVLVEEENLFEDTDFDVLNSDTIQAVEKEVALPVGQ